MATMFIRADDDRRRQGIRLALAIVLFLAVLALEWFSHLDYSLGIFYVLPVIVAATVLNRWQVVALSIACAFIRGQFHVGLQPIEFGLRFIMAVLAYSGAGMLVAEMSRHRRTLFAAYAKLKVEQALRERAEHQLRNLAESSPAAIVTLGHDGMVLSANRAAHDVLGVDASHEELIGQRIDTYIPMFAQALTLSTRQIRNAAVGWAKRADGSRFPISTWFSTYGEGEAHSLAGIFVDVSEEVRDRELEAFRHFSDHSRLLAGAVSHEIRNLCSAIRVVTSNLSRHPEIIQDPDYHALTKLVESLSQIASMQLRASKEAAPHWCKLGTVLEQLRLVIEPDWADAGGEIKWDLSAADAHVQGDEHGLLQVFLNLTQNALRAVQQSPNPTLEIRTRAMDNRVVVSVIDSGPGIQDPAHLFRPFTPDADGTGLGLYVSRTLTRTFGGELSHQPTAKGCRFDVTLLGWHGEE